MLIPGKLRTIRLALRLDRKAAAEILGLDERTLHRHESERFAPRTMHGASVKGYCSGYKVEAKAFAKWAGPNAKRKAPADSLQDSTAPSIALLSQRAKHEHLMKAQKFVNLDGESLEVVGNVLTRDIMNTCNPYDGKRFVVDGVIEDSDGIPATTTQALGARYGDGARYRVGREVVKGLPVYVTVFAPQAAHAVYLNECNRSHRPVSLIVRIFVRPPDEYLKGFLIFEKNSIFRPWCFVVEEILPSVSTST